MSKLWDQKRAIVTGAASGIGRAVALALAAEGALVRMVDCNEETLITLAKQSSGNLIACPCNLSDLTQWRSVLSQEPFPEILINNAATAMPDILIENDKTWRQLLSVNFEAVAESCLHAAREMPENGRIVNISTIQTRLYERGNLAYTTAKAAVEQLTRGLAVELAPRRILVNAVAPGYVDTAMSRAGGVNELETDWFLERYVRQARIPLQRAAQPEEIAKAVLFLASPENTYITGQIIALDGGLSLTL